MSREEDAMAMATTGFHAPDAVESIAKDLLEALDSLAIVYESAECFSRLFDVQSIAEFTLERVIEAVGVSRGFLVLSESERLCVRAERGHCADALDASSLAQLYAHGRGEFLSGAESEPLLAPSHRGRALLQVPLCDGQRSIGCIVLLSEVEHSFSTADLKLVSAVASQAAIALCGCQHFAAVLLERAKLQSVIHDHAEGIIVLEADNRTALTNAVARALLDIAPTAPEGFDLRQWTEAHWRGTEALAPFWDGEIEEVRGEILRGSGADEQCLAYSARIVRGTDQRIANRLVSLHDLSDKRREERVKQSFLALVSHKLRTPLAAVKGILTILDGEESRGGLGLEERRELLQAADLRVDELTGILDRLLAMVEVLDGSWTTLGRSDLELVVKRAVEHFQRRAQALGIRIECQIDATARWVSIPVSRCRLVLENLIDNALKFGARRGGHIRITAELAADGFIELEVEDDGPGIGPQERHALFESFRQSDADFTGSVPGMGIGLALVREIAHRVGGSAELVDAPGARFRVRLPAAASAANDHLGP